MNVKVLGGGCHKCETLLANTREAVANVGVEAEIEYITDFAVIAGYGIMSMPALIVDEKILPSVHNISKAGVLCPDGFNRPS